MQDFLKEWGPAIVTAVVILILVGIVKAVSPLVSNGMKKTVNDFSNSANLNTNDINGIINQ